MIANDKNQTPLLLDRQLVLSLVEQFAATGKPACTSYRPEKLAEAFAALPVVHRDPHSGAEFVDYHAAQRVIDQYECYKLTGICNSWTQWMRLFLRARRCRPL